MSRKQVDYQNFVKKLGVQAYKLRKMAEKGTPYEFKVGEINFVEDLNDPYVTGTEFTVKFENRKPAKTKLLGAYFLDKEAQVSYTGIELEEIYAQQNRNWGKGDIDIEIKLSGSNAHDWLSGKIEVFALLME